MRSKFSLEAMVGLFVIIALLIFGYMGFQIGAFRFDKRHFYEYVIFFNEITGLSKKADIKIAGVKVGWVDQIILDKGRVVVKLRVSRNYPLYENATGIIRQDGLFGPRYIEIIPGSSFLPQLNPGDVIGPKGRPHYDMDALLQIISHVSAGVDEVVQSLKDAVATPDGRTHLKDIVQNIHSATEHIAHVAKELDESISRQDGKLDAFLGIGVTFQDLSSNLESNVLPAFQESVEQIATVFDRDFNRIAGRFDTLGGSFDSVGKQVSTGLTKVDAIVEKINSGQGFLGKLINEDVVYQDLRSVTHSVKNYIEKIDQLKFVLDAHFETMQNPAESYHFQDSKGYLEIRMYTKPNFFYLLQVMGSEKGFLKRKEVQRTYEDIGSLDPVDPLTVNPRVQEYMQDVFREKRVTFPRNVIKVGLQCGITYQRFTLRCGIFDSFIGFAADVAVGSPEGKFFWISTFEAFDLVGFNRQHDRRPHLKYINRVFPFGRKHNAYLVFGADDFISKKDANVFFGVGFKFGDESLELNKGTGGITV